MTEHTGAGTLGSWLADLPDERLVRLLELRPDLAQPPPGGIAALAARAQARQSVRAATDELNFLQLAVIDALLMLGAGSTGVTVSRLVGLIGERAPDAAVLAALDDLRERALCWGDSIVRVAAEVTAGLPWHPGQVTCEELTADPERIRAAIDELDEPQRDLLDRLLAGSPIGQTRDAAPGAPPDRPVPQLLAAGLLRQLDDETVILPRLVGQLLRHELPGPMQLVAPDPTVSQTTPADVDAAAAGAVIDSLRELDSVVGALGRAPVPELRAGGLGIREVKRLAKVTGVDERRLGLLLEVAAAAGLITVGLPDSTEFDDDPLGRYWAPTVAADRFTSMTTAQRWRLLAGTWLDLPARPGLIGSRGPDGKACGALSTPLFSTAAPLDRRLLLGLLAELPAGAGVSASTAAQALIWQRPRWSKRLQPAAIADLLAEAHALGLVGRDAISSPGRALLSDDPDAADTSTAVMTRVLPEPLDHFLVQADLTVVVPGPLERKLAEELATVATVESAGAAMVYRVSEQTIRHALDVGRTGAALHAFFEHHSKTPVPQGLSYLIDDVARRHGRLRIGMAASFVRCDDPALLAQAVAGTGQLGLRVLAPTVAVSQAPIADVLAALRDAGFAPAAEDFTGAVVDLRPGGARLPTPAHRRTYRPPARPNSESLTALVRLLRAPAVESFDNVRLLPATTMTVLKRAALDQATVVIGYVDTAGVQTRREVAPIAVRGSQLVAFDSTSDRVRDFAIHRITSIVSVDSG